MSDTDFGKIQKYSNFVLNDPFRNGLHYPAVLKYIGDLEEKTVLDVGCGDGFFDRILAEKGAKVVAYDKAPEKIEEAKSADFELNDKIKYLVSTPQTLKYEGEFDKAVSVMVLSYAVTLDDLKSFFSSTYKALRSGGSFYSIIFNPNFEKFGKKIGSRIFDNKGNDNVQVNFLNPKDGQVMFTSILHQFSREKYELLAMEAGFKDVKWYDLHPTQELLDEYGNDFWEDVIISQPYSLFVVGK